jgi:hypothetical protein
VEKQKEPERGARCAWQRGRGGADRRCRALASPSAAAYESEGEGARGSGCRCPGERAEPAPRARRVSRREWLQRRAATGSSGKWLPLGARREERGAPTRPGVRPARDTAVAPAPAVSEGGRAGGGAAMEPFVAGAGVIAVAAGAIMLAPRASGPVAKALPRADGGAGEALGPTHSTPPMYPIGSPGRGVRSDEKFSG